MLSRLLSKFLPANRGGPSSDYENNDDRVNAITRLLRLASSTATGWQQQQSLEAVRHLKGWAYVAVRAIAEKVAQYKPVVAVRQRRPSGVKSKHSKHWRYSVKKMTTLADDEDLVELDDSHDLCRLLDDPNGPDVTFSLWYKTMMYAELCGKVIWWLPYNNAGEPCEIWVLPTQWLRPDPGTREDDPLIKGYWVRPTEGIVGTTYIDAKDVIEWTYPSPLSYYDGYGPMQGGATWLDTAESMDNSRWHQMKNLHNPGLVLTTSPDLAKGKMDEATIKLAYAMLNERLRGEGKNRMPLILPPGWASAGRYGASDEELDFTTSNEQIRDQTLSLFRVPKGIVGLDPNANTSAYAPNSIFYDQCINPKLFFLGQVLTEKLARRFGDDYVIYWQNEAPNDPVLEHSKANDALDRCAITINEYREHLGKAPVEWGDTPMQRPGYLPLMQGTQPLLSQEEIAGMLQGGQDDPKSGLPAAQRLAPPAKRLTIKQRLKKAHVPDDAIKFTLPSVRQETSYSCGAAAVSAICRAYGIGPDDEEYYRNELQTDPEVGTDEQMIREFFDRLGMLTAVSTETTDDQLRQYLDSHAPVLMLIQAWGDMPEDYGNPRSDEGHYVVAIGYTEDDLIVEDPALGNTRGYIAWDELEKRWHLPGLERWAMCVRKVEKMTMVRSWRSIPVSKNGIE